MVALLYGPQYRKNSHPGTQVCLRLEEKKGKNKSDTKDLTNKPPYPSH